MFLVNYWHNDNGQASKCDTAIEAVNLLNDYWDLEGFSDRVLLSIISSPSFESIHFGSEELGCCLAKISEEEFDV